MPPTGGRRAVAGRGLWQVSWRRGDFGRAARAVSSVTAAASQSRPVPSKKMRLPCVGRHAACGRAASRRRNEPSRNGAARLHGRIWRGAVGDRQITRPGACAKNGRKTAGLALYVILDLGIVGLLQGVVGHPLVPDPAVLVYHKDRALCGVIVLDVQEVLHQHVVVPYCLAAVV